MVRVFKSNLSCRSCVFSTPVEEVPEPSSEPEHDLHRRLRAHSRFVARLLEFDEVVVDEVEEMANKDAGRTLLDFGKPTLEGLELSINKPTVGAHQFEIKSSNIQMVQNMWQFDGKDHEDPNTHFEIKSGFTPLSKFVTLPTMLFGSGCSRPSQGLQRETFYNGLEMTGKQLIDAYAGGDIGTKTPQKAYDLLEKVASKSYTQHTSRARTQRQGVHQVGDQGAYEQVDFMSNKNRPQNNPYSNTYNPGWRNHLNFSWKSGNNSQQPPGFTQRPPFQHQSHQSQGQSSQFRPQQGQFQGQGSSSGPPPAPEGKSSLEDMVARLLANSKSQNQLAEKQNRYMEERFHTHETELRNQKASIQTIENQVGQIAKLLSERPPGGLPSNTEPNPKAHVKAITLRSGSLSVSNALADLSASINLMPYAVFAKLELREPTPTRMSIQLADRSVKYLRGIVENMLVKVDRFVFPVDFVILDMDDDKNVPIILGRLDVYSRRLTLRVDEEVVTFDVGRSMQHTQNQDDSLYFIETIYSCCSTVFAMVDRESEPIEWSSIEDPPPVELKELPSHLEYAFLDGESRLPVIIASDLTSDEKERLLEVLRQHKQAIAWRIMDIKGINPSFCTHKIHMEDDYKPVVQHQRRLNPNMQEVVKKEVIKLLDAGLIYPISDSPWVGPVQVVPKKGGMTVITNERNELIPTRTVTGWRVCIDYRKLNDATRKDHFPLPFID
ncbi:hypothetical protein L1987_53391 [Smallanthus sonchifolius]|uniref:Uncharacterized protein n=1 Tax=Smallanthus sonchifolius TaxID=185202 RepID=A0ACB9EW50_9ASTR|nr:hypothetical protein L1987_53391 [Smallanthus sonchifolius]